MSDESYLKLREFMDRSPLGFPRTESGVEIKILKRFFTEEEAGIAVLLSPLPEEVSIIAGRTGLDENELGERLESMSKKGTAFRIRREDKILYRAVPFMIGLYEYAVNMIDRELAMLFSEYYETAFQHEMGVSNVPGFKVIPVEKNVSQDSVLLPFHKLEEKIRAARVISVADCVCRKETRLLGEGCSYPMEDTCLNFGVAAEYYIENGIGRKISAEEAINILNETDKAGLVHAGANSKHLSNICNCCPCCCASMKGITQKGHDKRKYFNALFEAVIDEDSCSACGDCLERCPVDAITVEDTAAADRDKCLGCGLCATACPVEAITMHLREDREEPFDRVLDMALAIMEAKKKISEKEK